MLEWSGSCAAQDGPLRRIGKPRALGSTLAVAGYLEVSIESLARVRAAGGLQGPVLWAPVALAAA
jgi:N-acyl-L-homoserine lactone synthetase